MIIQHHPNDDTLLRHAAGKLNAGLALVTEAHLHDCAHCRDRVATFEAVGGTLLDSLPPAAMTLTAFTDVLARLGERPASSPSPPYPASGRAQFAAGYGTTVRFSRLRYRPLAVARPRRALQPGAPALGP